MTCVTEERYIYTDASFSDGHQLAVAGFFVFKTRSEHENKEIVPCHVRLTQFSERNNIRAELRGALGALQSLDASDSPVTLFTDCRAVANLPQRQEKLQSTNYVSRRKNSPLANADLYELLFLEFIRLRPALRWVKGHSPRTNQTLNQKHLSCIDKIVRKKLRAILTSDLSDQSYSE